ncbi:hypothetical protein GCM10023205_33500 [Yinghuangia aomiensis]|uniref:Uncharacterized protein n=1 Tax=Yinghuangia aomiensis TaxID=676205 RepID=A0ABP9HBE0_9ACTN
MGRERGRRRKAAGLSWRPDPRRQVKGPSHVAMRKHESSSLHDGKSTKERAAGCGVEECAVVVSEQPLRGSEFEGRAVAGSAAVAALAARDDVSTTGADWSARARRGGCRIGP